MSMIKSYPGFLINVEGIDGSGKTTHVKMTKEWLESLGKIVIILKEPTQGKYGKLISELASKKMLSPEKELELFTEDRKEDVKNNILPALNTGNIVIMDRYYFSNIAYQAARGLNFDNIKVLNEEFSPIPDLVIVLDIDPIVGMQRINERKNTVEHFENVEYLMKVREYFEIISKQPNAVLIPTNKSIDEVQKLIENSIRNKLPSLFR